MNAHDSPTTRRQLLKYSGVALLTTGTSGCVETLPPLGQQVRYGRVDVPDQPTEHSDPVYRRWLPAASVLPDDDIAPGEDDLDPGYVNYVEPGFLGEDFDGDGDANRFGYTYQKPHVDYFGVGYEHYDRVIGLLSFGSTFVLEGDIDPTSVATTLTDSGFDTAGSYADYDVFDRDDGRRTAAVSGDAIVWAHHSHSRAIVEAVADAERGAVERHHETDELFAFATETAGARPWTWFGAPRAIRVDGTLEPMSVTIDEDAVYTFFHLVYPADQSASERAIRDALEKYERAIEAGTVDLQVDGRIATILMRRPHASVDDPYEGVEIPQITWGVTREGDALEIRHEAGETTPAESLAFSIEGPEGRSPTDAQFEDTTDVVAPGDAITVQVPDDASGKDVLGEFSPVGADAASVFVVSTFP